MQSETTRIFPNVHLGKNVTIQDWVIIGLPPRGAEAGELKTIIGDGAVIRSHTVIYAGSQIGAGFQTGHRAILGTGLEIGTNCSVGTSSVMIGYAQMLDGARVHGHSKVGEFSAIQEKAWVGPYCLLDSKAQAPIVIAAGAILGARVYISPGVRIGERALIAAGVIINQNISPYRLIAGNPPRSLRDIGNLTCPYQLIEHPYESDDSGIKELIKVQHKVKELEPNYISTWQHQLWERLGKTL